MHLSFYFYGIFELVVKIGEGINSIRWNSKKLKNDAKDNKQSTLQSMLDALWLHCRYIGILLNSQRTLSDSVSLAAYIQQSKQKMNLVFVSSLLNKINNHATCHIPMDER